MEFNLPKRKTTRIKDYDYSTTGKYFITVCTKDKKQLLSKIIVGEGFHALPQNKLTLIGMEVENPYSTSMRIMLVQMLKNML